MDEHKSTWCTECGNKLSTGVKFCPDCGHKVAAPATTPDPPEPITATDEDPPAVVDESPADSGETTRSERRLSRPLIIGAVAALGLAVAGGAIWGLTRSSIAETQFEVSAPVLMSTLDDMSGAQSSRMVRQVAGNADVELTTVNATLDSDPTADGADRLVTMRDALLSLAALGKYRVENTEVWKDNRNELLGSLDTLSSYGGVTEAAATSGDDTARNLDDMTRRIDKAMVKYRKKVREAKAEARSEREFVAAYHSNMEYLIDRYTGLRQDTAAFIDQMNSEQMYMFEVTDYFTQAASDRRSVQAQMTQLSAPSQMASEHSQIVAVIGRGADAIDAAVAAIEDAECFYGECYFEFNTQWQQFQDESDQITVQYGDAYDSWKAQIARTERQTGEADLPDKPDL